MLPWRTTTALALTAVTAATAAVAPVVVSGPSPFSGCPTPPSFEGAEVEPALAAHPGRAGRLVAVYQQDRYHGGGARGIVAATSTDGGRTWRKAALPVSACAGAGARPAPFASDPWASVGPEGRIYASTLSDVVSITTSVDWGRTWSTPVLLRGRYGLTDKETVTADPRKPGWAYATWSDYQQTSPPATTSDEVVSVTHNGGRSWSTPRVVVRHGNEAGPEDGQIVVDPRNGRLYLFTAWIRKGYATPTRPAWYPRLALRRRRPALERGEALCDRDACRAARRAGRPQLAADTVIRGRRARDALRRVAGRAPLARRARRRPPDPLDRRRPPVERTEADQQAVERPRHHPDDRGARERVAGRALPRARLERTRGATGSPARATAAGTSPTAQSRPASRSRTRRTSRRARSSRAATSSATTWASRRSRAAASARCSSSRGPGRRTQPTCTTSRADPAPRRTPRPATARVRPRGRTRIGSLGASSGSQRVEVRSTPPDRRASLGLGRSPQAPCALGSSRLQAIAATSRSIQAVRARVVDSRESSRAARASASASSMPAELELALDDARRRPRRTS